MSTNAAIFTKFNRDEAARAGHRLAYAKLGVATCKRCGERFRIQLHLIRFAKCNPIDVAIGPSSSKAYSNGFSSHDDPEGVRGPQSDGI